MAITLPNNPAFQNVNLSAVTQAAKQSPLTAGANSNRTTLPSSGGGNPATSLNLSGATSQLGQNFANLGKTVGQVPIPGPSGQSSSPGGAPPYPSNVQNQTVTFQGSTFKSDGRGGWVYIGPAQPSAPQQPLNFSNIALPSFVPPPSPVQSASMVPTKGVSAATGPLSSVTPGSGGVAGQASPALTQAGQATKGLQLPGLPQSVLTALSSFAPGISQGVSEIGKDVSQGVQKLKSEIPIVSGKGLTGQPIHTGAAGTPDIGLSEAVQGAINPLLSTSTDLSKQGGSLLKNAITGMLGIPGVGTAPSAKGNFNRSKIGTSQALTTPQGEQTNIASMQNLSGNTDSKQGIQSFLSGKTDLQTTASNIASPQAPAEIAKAINSAVKSGDMASVDKLTNLYQAVQQQNNFIQQIGQIVSALSAGFGTPNAPGVTEARTPMIQQGIGQALTSPQVSNTQLPNQQGNQIPYLPTNLQTVGPVQQQRPLLNPFMG